MISQNMHIHSKYSWDCKMEIEDIAKVLLENNIKYGAITDHVEFDREPIPYILTKLKIRNLEIDEINKRFNGKVVLLKGLEISEPHIYKDQVSRISDLDLDFIMGSIHRIETGATNQIDIWKIYSKYYQDVLNMIEDNQIDVVGHLDYINRYYGYNNEPLNKLKEIMIAIKEHNQIIEINTSAQRRCRMNVFPSLDKICKYRLYNQDIIIGTDAHRKEELTDNLEQAEIITKELGLKPVILQKRKRIII